MHPHKLWRRYEECRPDELAAIVAQTPVAIWPMGMIEHHGWHLPIGFDTLKAQRICLRLIERTGGVLLPPLYWGWGGDGGHADFKWTHYRKNDVSGSIIREVCEQLITFGFRSIVALAGHGPYHEILDEQLAYLRPRHPGVLFLFGLEIDIAGAEPDLKMDHAAIEETSLGLELLPDLVDLDALKPGHNPATEWPHNVTPPTSSPYPSLVLDPQSPLFSQAGQDARLARADRVKAGVERVVTILAQQIETFGSGTRHE
jgi:creatinine amidohydrolase